MSGESTSKPTVHGKKLFPHVSFSGNRRRAGNVGKKNPAPGTVAWPGVLLAHLLAVCCWAGTGIAAAEGNPWRGNGRFVVEDRRAGWEDGKQNTFTGQNAFIGDEDRPSSWDRTVSYSYWRGEGSQRRPEIEKRKRESWTREENRRREELTVERTECESQKTAHHTGNVRRRYRESDNGYEFPPDSSIGKRVDPVYSGSWRESWSMPMEVVGSARDYPPPSVTGAFRQPGALGNGRWEEAPSLYPSDRYDGGERGERDRYAVDRRTPVPLPAGGGWQVPWPAPFVVPPGRGGWRDGWSFP